MHDARHCRPNSLVRLSDRDVDRDVQIAVVGSQGTEGRGAAGEDCCCQIGLQFERRHRRLQLLAASIEEDIQKTPGHNGADLQRMLPIQRCEQSFLSSGWLQSEILPAHGCKKVVSLVSRVSRERLPKGPVLS